MASTKKSDGLSRRPRRKFTDEFKAEAVRMVEQSGGQIGRVARELSIYDSTLGNWVQQARAQAAGAPTATSDSAPRCERYGVVVNVTATFCGTTWHPS